MTSSFTLLRVRGIPIGAHWSWLFVFALVTWSLASTLFPSAYPGLSDSTYVFMGVVASILFFASILLHELGHAFRALREGMVIDGITLWLFGGVARFKGMFPSAGAEFRIAVAGPLVSAAIAAGFGSLTFAGDAFGWPDAVRGVADYLWRINAIVTGFNLVPALPLDGGRILRSYLWARKRSFLAATLSAARPGKAFGGLLVAIGLVDFLTGGGGGGGLWFVFLGWFLIQAAEAEATAAVTTQLLQGRIVRDFMTPDPTVLPPDSTVSNLLDEVARGRGHSFYPVVRDGDLLGLASLKAAASVPPAERPSTSVTQIMVPRSSLAVLQPDTDMASALQAMEETHGRAPVLDDGRIVGIITTTDALHALEVEQARGMAEARPTARGASVVAWVVVVLALAVAAGLLYRPPYAVVHPGPALDVTRDITITGVATDDVNGDYLLTSVRIDQPTALGLLVAAVGSDDEILPIGEVIPTDVDPDEYFRQQEIAFRQSEMIAAAAAASAAGLPVSLNGTGAVVERVIPSSPAAEVLRPGDVIVEVNGTEIEVLTDLPRIVRAQPPGSEFRVTVERGGVRRTFRIESARLSDVAEGATGIGVLVSTRDFSVDIPFEVRFRERDIGGPSAGLAYALAIYDLLDPADVAAGRTVAATGTINVSGEVGPIGGIREKADSVEEAGADIFLVPERQVDEASGNGVRIEGVSDLEEAIETLTSATS